MKLINVADVPTLPPQWPQFDSQRAGPRCSQLLWPRGIMMLMLCEKAAEVGRHRIMQRFNVIRSCLDSFQQVMK